MFNSKFNEELKVATPQGGINKIDKKDLCYHQ